MYWNILILHKQKRQQIDPKFRKNWNFAKKCSLLVENVKKGCLMFFYYQLPAFSDSSSNRLNRLKSCCHYSLRDLCVHTDGAWWKLENYFIQKNVSKYPDGYIICLTYFSVGCAPPVKKSNKFMVRSIFLFVFFFHFAILMNHLMGAWFMLNCLFFSKKMTQASCFM